MHYDALRSQASEVLPEAWQRFRDSNLFTHCRREALFTWKLSCAMSCHLVFRMYLLSISNSVRTKYTTLPVSHPILPSCFSMFDPVALAPETRWIQAPDDKTEPFPFVNKTADNHKTSESCTLKTTPRVKMERTLKAGSPTPTQYLVWIDWP